jgi:hypothetical protein
MDRVTEGNKGSVFEATVLVKVRGLFLMKLKTVPSLLV